MEEELFYEGPTYDEAGPWMEVDDQVPEDYIDGGASYSPADINYDYDAPIDDHLEFEGLTGFDDTVRHCVLPSMESIATPLARILLSCIALRLCTKSGIFSSAAINLMSTAVGFWLSYTFFQMKVAYLVLFCILVYVGLCVARDRDWTTSIGNGPMAVTIAVTYLVVCELFVVDEKSWHTVTRSSGAQMIMAMKVISVAFDMDARHVLTLPSALYFAGYCLSPSTVIFGPWISYNSYLKLLQNFQTSWLWALKSLVAFLVGMMFLTLSTCWTAYIFDESTLGDSSQWVLAYRDALSYRSSHYFVSFVSEATCNIAGLPSDIIKSDLHVAKPQHIELPRSLVEVVTHWNIPMHFWLKTYVFKIFRPYGNFVAVIATYAASSLLHGLNFQLAAVLLSLGLYTYVEHVLRQKLSRVYSGCIQARQCRRDCGHSHDRTHFGVRIANLVFGALALLHLTYLGLMFDSTPTIEETGYNMMHTLRKWGELRFTSHWIALATYIFHVLL